MYRVKVTGRIGLGERKHFRSELKRIRHAYAEYVEQLTWDEDRGFFSSTFYVTLVAPEEFVNHFIKWLNKLENS